MAEPINWAVVLVDVDGAPVKEETTKRSMTLARACVGALDAPLESDRAHTLSEMMKRAMNRGRLVEEILHAEKTSEPLTLSTSDIELIKERVAGWFTNASFVRRVCLMLPTKE